jgi:predicted AlkP superfamily pyrophosphatase or phosphodiesterase
VTLLVVSDHGMSRTLGTVNLYRAFEVLDFAVEIIPSGPIAHIFVAPERLAATEALAQSLPQVTTWRRDTVPLAFAYRHPTRTGDLVLMAEPGWTFDGRNAEPLPGVHGHDPTSPDMGAIFFAWGDGIRPGSRVTQPRAVDIVPTICHLLHLPVPAGVEGRALEEILAAPRGDP